MIRFLVYVLLIIIIIFVPLNTYNTEAKKYINISKPSVKIRLIEQKNIPKPKVIKKIIKKKKVIKKKKIIKKILKKKPIKKVIKKEPKPVEKVKIQEEIIEPKMIKDEPILETLEIAQTISSPLINQNKIDKYYALIYEKIDKYKKYPKKAIRFKQEDTVKVYFVVNKDGVISDFKILKESKYNSLNKAVKKMFKRIKKVQKPPKDIDTPLEIEVGINFKLTKD